MADSVRGSRFRGRREAITLDLETTTPIMGGGARAREPDRHDPIRVPGIRGQLRFWWRALHACRYQDEEKLLKAETELWGGAVDGNPVRSRVDLWVEVLHKSQLDSSKVGFNASDAYALWPARQPPAPRWLPGMRFRLHARVPGGELAGQLERSLRAWILFGGVGGRTRRGCGSLRVLGQDIERWLPAAMTMNELRRLLGDHAFARPDTDEPSETPSLHGAELFCPAPRRDPLPAGEAWHTALAWLYDFRQGPARSWKDMDEYAREPKKGNRPGRSRWPEADKVRLLSDSRKDWADVNRWAHKIRYQAKKAVWPRAGFGLPIKFQFQRKPKGEPNECQLNWWNPDDRQVHDRLASPLILKPLALADDSFVPIALWLYRAYPERGIVGIARNGKLDKRSRSDFYTLHAQGDPVLYKWLDREGPIRDAFWAWLEDTDKAQELVP